MRKSLLFIALALTLCVAFCVASFVSFAEDLTVTVTQANGTDVSISEGANTLSDDDGVITYDKANNTVTLSGVDAKKITVNGTATLVIEGENTLTNDGAAALDVVSGDVTVSGTGTLTLSATGNTVYVQNGTYTQTGATVKSTATTGVDGEARTLNAKNGVSITGGTFTGSATLNYGIYSANGIISISGGTVSSTSKANAFQGVGIDISGGTVTATASSSDTSFRATGKAGIKISAGDVTASSKGSTLHSQGSGDLVISGGTLNIAGTSNAIWARGGGSIYLKGGKITVNGTGYAVRSASGNIFISGGDIDLIQPNNASAVSADAGFVTISGGTLDVTCTSNAILAKGGGVTITGGSTTVNGSTSEQVRSYTAPFAMRGGSLKVTGSTNLIITATGCDVNISGGTLDLSASNGGCINSGGNITISEGRDPKLILNSPKSYAMRLNTGSKSFSMTDGNISGSAKHFLFVKDTKCSFNMGSDVALDFTVADLFLSNATPGTFTLDSAITWEEGKELTSSTTAASVKSTLPYIYINSVEDLLKIGVDEAYPLTGSYRLTTDLDLADMEWTPLGVLTGTFDGRGYIIKNMHTGTESTPATPVTNGAVDWGFFGGVTNGTIKNLGFENVFFNLKFTHSSNYAAAAVTGRISGTSVIDNCAVLSGTIKLWGYHQAGASGIAGTSPSGKAQYWTISNCYNAATIISDGATRNNSGSYAVAAGIISRPFSYATKTIRNCFNVGKITAIDSYTGTNETLHDMCLAGNIISYQGIDYTTTENTVVRSNNYAITDTLSFSGKRGGILQDDLNKTTLVDPLGALSPETSFSGLGSKWIVKTPDGNDYYPILSTFENYAEPVVITDELVAEVTEKIETALDGLMVANNLIPTDVTGMFTDFAPTAKATLTLVEKADLNKAGSWDLTVTLSNGTEIKRTLVIDQLPNVEKVDYDFALDVAGIGQGTITVTLNQDAVAGKYIKALYWGNEDGALEGYSALAIDSTISCVDDTLVFNTPERLYIPSQATRVYITLDGIIAGSYEIPAVRKLTLSAQKYAYGVTSDTHHYSSSSPATAEKFANVLGFMENKGADFMVVTGDFTNNGTAAQWANFNAHYEAGGFTIPVWACTGNHDAVEWNTSVTREEAILNMNNGLETFANPDYTQDKNGNQYKVTVSDVNPLYDYTVEFEGDLFVYLGIGAYHSNHYKADGGETNSSQHLKLDQIEWLDQVLADWYNTSENYGNVYLMFHYTPYEHGLWLSTSELTGRGWSKKVDGFMTEWNSSELLYNVLAKYPNLIHFNGHTHTGLTSYKNISATRHWKLLDDSGDTVFYEAVNTPLGYTAINGPSSQAYQGFYVSVHEEGILITGYQTDINQVQSQATFFIPKELNDETRVRINDGYIQYVQGYGAWQNLADVTKLSDNEIEVQLSETHVQYREVGAETWIDLIAIDEIDGEMTFDVDVTLSATVNGGKDTEVQLLDKDGNLIETVTSVNGVVNFSTLTLEEGVYTYTVKQNAENGNGWFYDANVYTITVTVADGKATIEGEAIFTNTDRVPFAEGKIIDGKYVVTETGKATEMGLIKIGEDYYYAGPNGVLVTNQKYYAWRLNENCDIEKGWYYFDADGKLVDTGIVDGVYYENGKPTEKGLFKIGEDYYYAGPNGKLVSDQRYYAWKADEKCDLPTAWYWFDETGKMIGSSAEGEIVEINGVKYFYRSGKPTEMGLFEYEGNYYVAQYDGKIITGKYYVWKVQEGLEDLNGAWRYFGNDGKLLQGIVDGYYYVNGVRTEMGLFKYTDNNYYVAQYDGKIITSENYTKYGAGKYYVWKIHESANDKKAGWYFFDAEGKLITE